MQFLLCSVLCIARFGDRQGVTTNIANVYTDATGKQIEIGVPVVEVRKVHARLLEMLRTIDKISRDLHISYWLCGGTLIGALRHGGFVPWDGDADISMTERDFRIFEKEAPRKLPKDMWLQTCRSEKEQFGRSGFPSCHLSKLRDLHSNYADYPYKTWHNGLQVDFFTSPNLQFSACGGTMQPPLRSTSFEGVLTWIPHNAEQLLTDAFGNWRVMPAVDKRRPHEGRVVWAAPAWTKNKYKSLYNARIS